MACHVTVRGYRRRKEISRLKKIIQRHGEKVTVKRAQVVLASVEGATVPEMSRLSGCSQDYARSVIHAFNEAGFESLWHVCRGGRKPTFDEDQRARIGELAVIPPRSKEVPINRWTLKLLAEQAAKEGVVKSISHETVRQILREQDVRIRRTKTWKDSRDPDKEAKWRRIKRLYRHCPPGAHVISFDPFGPLEIRPVHGRALAKEGHMLRLPATYSRKHGVRHLLGWLDVHTEEMGGVMVETKNWTTILKAFRRIRARHPMHERIYLILDNASSHKKEEVREWARANNVVLVFTATNASWMNRIESHFDSLRDKVLRASYPQSHDELCQRVFDYLKWRNARKRKEHRERICNQRRVA